MITRIIDIQTEVNVICRTLRRITLTEVWKILGIMRKQNPIIVLLYIQNSHTKMQVKCGSKKTRDSCYKILLFVIFARFEVVTSSASNIFLTPPSNNAQYSPEMTSKLPDIENELEYVDQ